MKMCKIFSIKNMIVEDFHIVQFGKIVSGALNRNQQNIPSGHLIGLRW
jgi:hypothetical protein